MNPFRIGTARTYQAVDLETKISAASPHQLILMLFDGALTELSLARQHMGAKNIPAKGQAITRAMRIIGEGLRASLDMDRGGAISVQLGALYDYMLRRLLEANVKNNPAMVAEVASLLGDIRGAWAQIGASTANNTVPVTSLPSYAKIAPAERRAVSYGAA